MKQSLRLFCMLLLGFVALGSSQTADAQVRIQPFAQIFTLDLNGNGNIDAVILRNNASDAGGAGVGATLVAGTFPNYSGFTVAGYTFNTAVNGGMPYVVDAEGAGLASTVTGWTAAYGATAALIGGASPSVTNALFAGPPVAADGDQDIILFVNEKKDGSGNLIPDGNALPEVQYNQFTGSIGFTTACAGGANCLMDQIQNITLAEQDGVAVVLKTACTGDADKDGKIDSIALTFSEAMATTITNPANFRDVTGTTPNHNTATNNVGGAALSTGTTGLTWTTSTQATLTVNEMYSVAFTGEAPMLLAQRTVSRTSSSGAQTLADANGASIRDNFTPYGFATLPNIQVADCVAPYIMFAETGDMISTDGSLNATSYVGNGVLGSGTGTGGAHLGAFGNPQGNGKIDLIDVTFSERVTATAQTFGSYPAATTVPVAGLGVSGHSILFAEAPITTPGPFAAVSYDRIRLHINEVAVNTAETPTVSYTSQTAAASKITDLSTKNEATGALNGTSQMADDDASPAIMEVCTRDTNQDGFIDAYDVVFSEPLGNPNNYAANADGTITNAGLSATNFYDQTVGAGFFDHTRTTLAADKKSVRVYWASAYATTQLTNATPQDPAAGGLNYSRSGEPSDLVDQDPIQANDVSPFNINSNLAFKSTDWAPPVAMYGGTDDANADGYLDGYFIIFSEPMSDASFGCVSGSTTVPTSNFAIAGGVTGGAYGDVKINCVASRNAANDNIIWISFNPRSASSSLSGGKGATQSFNYDTGEVPAIVPGSSTNYCLTVELSEGPAGVPDQINRGGHTRSCLTANADGTGTVEITGAFSNLGSNFTAAHLHGANGAPVQNQGGTNVLSVTPDDATAPRSGIINSTKYTLDATQLKDYQDGKFYVNVHSADYPNGVLRANLTTIKGTDMVGNQMLSVDALIKDQNTAAAGFQTSRLFDDAEPVLLTAATTGQVGKNVIRTRFSEALKSFNANALSYVNTFNTGTNNSGIDAGATNAGFVSGTDRVTIFTTSALTSGDVAGDKLKLLYTVDALVGGYDMAGDSGNCVATLPSNLCRPSFLPGLLIPNAPVDAYGTGNGTTLTYPHNPYVSDATDFTDIDDGYNPLTIFACAKYAGCASDNTFGFDDTVKPQVFEVRTIDQDADGKIDHILVRMSEEVADASVVATGVTVAGYTVTGFVPVLDNNGTAGLNAGDYRDIFFNTLNNQSMPYPDGGSGQPTPKNAVRDMFEDTWLTFSVAEKTTGDTDATPAVTLADNAISDFKPNGNTAGAAPATTDCAGPAIMAGKIIGPSTIEMTFSEAINTTTLNVSGGGGDVRFVNALFPTLPFPGTITDLQTSGNTVRFFFTPHDIFNLNSTQTYAGGLSDVGVIADAKGNWNLQHSNPGYTAAPESGWFFGSQLANAMGVAGPVDNCSSVADVAGSNGSVVEASVCRSVNDRFHTSYVDGSTMVTRYEVYLIAQNGAPVTRTLVAQFQPPSQGTTADQNKFVVRFPVLPASSQARTYAVVAVGGADIITAGKADFTPINAAALELGDSLKLNETANKAGDITSPLVTIGTVASVEEPELAPAAVGKDLAIKDGTTGTTVIATLTKSADHDRVEPQTYMGLLNISAVVEVPLVTGYNVYDKDNKLVASVSKSAVTSNTDGTISFTFDAGAAAVTKDYTVKAYDGIQESTASNSAKGTALGGGAPGDADNNGCINVVDLSFFAASYGNAANYSTTFDFNNDGAVNLVDYVAFAKVFKGTCSVAGKSETLEASNGKLSVKIEGNLAIVSLTGADAQGVQFDIVADGAKVASVADGNVFRGNSLSAYSEANGGFTYAVASTEGSVNGGVVAVITLDGKAKSVKLGNVQIVEKSVAKLANDVTAMGVPTEFALGANYPNPFNPTTNINFSLPENVNTRLEVYDMTGRLVKTLVRGQLDAGVHTITWNGQDNVGAQVASGVYLYRLQAGTFVQTKTMTLLK